MEKEQKNLLKACKKQIKYSNWAVQGFMRANDYFPGSYQKLQSTDIWKRAKEQLLEYYRIKSLKLICFYCNTEILSNPTLHHKAYNWNRLFSPKNVIFLHAECHTKLHNERRGYKRGTWKKILKGMVRAIPRR
ncbi:MAG: hypothetical protein ACFFG0_14615 [Candidatus Thorarchaeota archaeon]